MKNNNLIAALFAAVFTMLCVPLSAQQNNGKGNGKGLSKGQEKVKTIKTPSNKKSKELPSTNGKKDAPELIRPKRKSDPKAQPATGQSKKTRPEKPTTRAEAPEKSKQLKTNNGKAHGKNKEDMNGKEFGQKRASDAKQKAAEKRQQTKQTINKADAKLSESKAKIKAAKVQLDADRKSNKISKEEAAKREATIKNAEQQMLDLEKSLREGKARLRNQKN